MNVTDVPAQDGFAPVITFTDGVTVRIIVSGSVLAVDVKQRFVATTDMLPEVAVPISTVIEVVFCPEVMLAPDGTVHV